MMRTLALSLLLAAAAGCQLADSQRAQEQQDLRNPLPSGQKQPFADLVDRSLRQVNYARDVADSDRWNDLVSVSLGLRETVEQFPQAETLPASLKDRIKGISTRLGQEAEQLEKQAREVGKLTGADREKKIKDLYQTMTSLNLSIRELKRAAATAPPPPQPRP